MEIAKVYIDTYSSISIVSVNASSTIIAQEPGYMFVNIDATSVNPLRDRGQVVAIFKGIQNDQKRKIYRYTIDASIEVARAKTTIAKDQLIAPENIEPIFLRIGSFADFPLLPSKAINRYTKRFIPKGSMVMQRDVGDLADVRKGQAITAVYISGAIEADMEVIALEDGQIGQIVSVKSKAGKVLRARVIARDRAEIE